MAGLAATFGRGVMTNHFIDMINADVVMVCGSNAAENHPISMRWIRRAKDYGAKVLSCDPRYTRTSSFSDLYVPFRSGTDIAFVGGIVNYALEHERIHFDYVLNYTNASFIVNKNYKFEDGLFAGWDGKKYDVSTWTYELDANGIPKRDLTLKDPNCVFQLLKKHYSRYDVDTVCSITGAPKDKYLSMCRIFTSTYKPDKAASWLYAMGTTQHSHGTQNTRVYCVLQLLLGNVGVAGGGVNALRGESNVQGSTDMGLLNHILTGYLAQPDNTLIDLATYIEKKTPKTNDPMSVNWWSNTPKYIVSLLKAFYGPKATKENEFCYHYLPKKAGNHSHMHIFQDMIDGKIKGAMMWGQNPAVGGPNSKLERDALAKLDWMVCIDIFPTETSTFWKRPGIDPKTIKTEVFLLPAAASVEKEGSVSNSGRWVQWRYAAQKPPGVAKSDMAIVDLLYKKVKELLPKLDTTGVPEPIMDLWWHYGDGEEPDPNQVAKEINGYYCEDVLDATTGAVVGKKFDQVKNFTMLKDDGSTCSGSWIYCGSYPKEGNMMARRDRTDAVNNIGLYPAWSWAWPMNRRIVYNRASVNTKGAPYNANKWVIRWNPALNDGKGGWEGDVPDGSAAPGTKHPFIMRPEGVGCLFAPTGLTDGPFPEHYEPIESPVPNMMSKQQSNPAAFVFKAAGYDNYGTPDKYPIIGTTYRVSEHWQAGAMTRNMPWLCELVPDVFVEMSEELAQEKGISNGDRVTIETARGSIQAYALVTKRFMQFRCCDKMVHQVGVVWHFGWEGIAKGDSANMLTPNVGDANTVIPEYKVFLCDIRKVV